MRNLIILTITILISNNSICQNVYETKKIFYFEGIDYKTKVEVKNSNSEIEITIHEKSKNQKKDTKIIKFDELFFERKIKLYNSLILLQDEKGVYYYDLISSNKYYSNIGNRYNEDINVGKYNPILENNILIIINHKLEIIDVVDINKYIRPGESWTLFLRQM